MKVKKTRLQAQDKGKEVKPEERTSVIAGRRVKAEKSGGQEDKTADTAPRQGSQSKGKYDCREESGFKGVKIGKANCNTRQGREV